VGPLSLYDHAMALKIVGRTPRMQISERRQTAREAKGVTMRCDGCDRDFGVVFPYGATALKRQRLMKAAADEHRKIGCVKGTTDEGRVFRIDRPRS
jgi:hypothetical protein